MHSFILFFTSPAPHRDLHSFPTRRSSDLAGQRRGTGGRPRDGDLRVPVRGRRRRGAGTRPRTRTRGGAARRDRKSTRLNSSHGYISYAVFCLKKKKNNSFQSRNNDV